MTFVYLGLGVAIAGGIMAFVCGMMDNHYKRDHTLAVSICFVVVGLLISFISWGSTWTNGESDAQSCNASGKIWYNKEGDPRWVQQCLTREQVRAVENQ